MGAIVYHASLNEAQEDAALSRLLGREMQRAPFDRLDWYALLARECLDPAHCFLAAARDGDERAVLPVRQTAPGTLEPLGNWYSFFTRARWTDHGAALLEGIARDLSRTHDGIVLSPLPEEDVAPLVAAFRKAGWLAFATPCDTNHILPVDGRSFAEYWAARPGRLRETVRRKGKKGVVDLRIATAFSEADWAAYEAIYRLSWKPEEGSPAFLRRFAEAEGAAGNLRLGIAMIDGKPVAAQFWTVEGGTAFIHKLAHDESAKAHSPGTLLTAALFEHVIDRDRVREVDFGTGDDPYKRDWMESTRTRWQVALYRPLAPRRWPAIAKALVRGLRT